MTIIINEHPKVLFLTEVTFSLKLYSVSRCNFSLTYY